MPDISSSVVAGDSDYNSAVDLLNNKNYGEAKNKAISAKNNFTSDTNDVHKKYINTVLNELELKINATDHLLEAIDNFKNHKNSTGNDYSNKANELMHESLEFQNVRNNLVKENPDLFK